MLFVPAESSFRTFTALLDHAKANPGRIRVATSGHGSNDDIIDKALATPERKQFCAETYSCTRNYSPQEAGLRVREFFETSRRYRARLGAGLP